MRHAMTHSSCVAISRTSAQTQCQLPERRNSYARTRAGGHAHTHTRAQAHTCAREIWPPQRLAHSVGTHAILVDLPWTPQHKTCTPQLATHRGPNMPKNPLVKMAGSGKSKKLHQHIPTHTQNYTHSFGTHAILVDLPWTPQQKTMYTAALRWLRTGNPICQKNP